MAEVPKTMAEQTPFMEELEAIDLEDDQQPIVEQPKRFRGWGRTVAVVLVLGLVGAACVAGASHANSLTKENVAGAEEMKWGFSIKSVFDAGKDKFDQTRAQIEGAKDGLLSAGQGKIDDLQTTIGGAQAALADKYNAALATVNDFLGWGDIAKARAKTLFNDVIHYEFKNPKEVLDAAQAQALQNLKDGMERITNAPAALIGKALGELCTSLGNVDAIKQAWMDKVKTVVMKTTGPCLHLKSQECKDMMTSAACEGSIDSAASETDSLRKDLCEVFFLKVADRMQDQVPEWLVPEKREGWWVGFVESFSLGDKLSSDASKLCAKPEK